MTGVGKGTGACASSPFFGAARAAVAQTGPGQMLSLMQPCAFASVAFALQEGSSLRFVH